MVTVREGIPERVTAEVANIFKRNISDVARDTRFIEDLDAKSVNYVQLIAVLDDALGIDIPFMELRRKKTVGEAIDFVAGLSS
jgi:acyl carrier protein